MPAPFVDRERELRALNKAFTEGQAHVLVLEGEAGIGKTTLIDRFLASLPEVRVLRAAGEESETDVPFAAVDQLLRGAGSSSMRSATGSASRSASSCSS